MTLKLWLRLVATGSALIHVLTTIQILTVPPTTAASSPLYQIVPPPVWAIATSIAVVLLLLGWRYMDLVYYGLAVASAFWGAAGAATIAIGLATGNRASWFTAIFLIYICGIHAGLCVLRLFVPRDITVV